MSQYPWDRAPEWAQYAATDADGRQYWYEQKPKPMTFSWVQRLGLWEEIDAFEGDWKETLEQRP